MSDEMLKKYSKIDQKHIINLGISAFSYFKNIEFSSSNNSNNNLIDTLTDENRNLKRKISEIENTNFNTISNLKITIREEIKNEFIEKCNNVDKDNIEFKNKIAKLENEISNSRSEHRLDIQKIREEYNTIISNLSKNNDNFNILVENLANDKAELAIKTMKEQLINTENKLKDLQTKYTNSSKGIEYEKIIYNEIEEHNNNKLGNIWDITHIGQTIAHKGDIFICHKDNGKKIMIDCKNHDCVPKEHREKFISDFESCSPDLAIMISRGTISTKKNYEVNFKEGKKLIYISNYPTGNPGYIFSIIECELDLNNIDETIDINNYKLFLEENYNESKKLQDTLIKQIDILKNRIKTIKDNYLKKFKIDIDIELSNNKKVKQSKEEKNTITPLKYEELEKRRYIIGKRSKHYLLYDDNGNPTIQYFRDATSKEKKEETLKKKNSKLEINIT